MSCRLCASGQADQVAFPKPPLVNAFLPYQFFGFLHAFWLRKVGFGAYAALGGPKRRPRPGLRACGLGPIGVGNLCPRRMFFFACGWS